MKTKKIWSFDTASKVAAAKTAKYGTTFVVVEAVGGGFNVKEIATLTAAEYLSVFGLPSNTYAEQT